MTDARPSVDDRSADGAGPAEVHGRSLTFILTGLMLVMLMAALDGTIVATALPTIASD